MHESETAVVRPYLSVADVEAAASAVEGPDCQIALPPMELPGHGKLAIYLQGGVQHGLWEG
ncbi:MAG: hypothetical protein R3325_13805 [Thermoanaerobaculia bacterium]|nr:hypothetical protein [Thermoanaerobaculia bacterium]